MKFGLFPNMTKRNIVDVLREAVAYGRDCGAELFLPDDIEPDLGARIGLSASQTLSREDVFRRIDVALSFGGDGTIIHLSRRITSYGKPVCGINLGELGFLNQIEYEDMKDGIRQLAEGRYEIERRSSLQAYIASGESRTLLEPVMNELLVTSPLPGKMARVNLSIDSGHTDMYPADGLLVATATGATGYNMSAGGPLLAPGNHSIVVTPVAPHLLQHISFVLNPTSRIELGMPERQRTLHVSVDGTFDYTLHYGETIRIESAPIHSLYVRFPQNPFFSTLRKKLNAAGQARE